MARWIGAVCWLMMLNSAFAQGPYAPQPASPPTNVEPVYPSGIEFTLDSSLIPLTPSGIPVQPFNPNQPAFVACPQCAMPVGEPPRRAEALLVTKVYGVADLVVGREGSADPNPALLSMLAQQSDELALRLATATVGAQGPQVQTALSELAQTIESTYADEFEDRGSITLHPATKSLVVRQTETVHVEIRDLLTQLRHVNDTEINVTLELFDLDDARMLFAFAHTGQVLDAAEVQEFRDLSPAAEGSADGEDPRMVFCIACRNGESASLPQFVLPGTMTAFTSEDRSEVRVLLNMPLGMDMGMPLQQSYQVPQAGNLLTIFSDGESGLVMLLSAEIEASEEIEQ